MAMRYLLDSPWSVCQEMQNITSGGIQKVSFARLWIEDEVLALEEWPIQRGRRQSMHIFLTGDQEWNQNSIRTQYHYVKEFRHDAVVGSPDRPGPDEMLPPEST